MIVLNGSWDYWCYEESMPPLLDREQGERMFLLRWAGQMLQVGLDS